MVQQNPALIQPLIQQLAQSNPALAQQLAANPEALYALLGGAGGGEGGEFGEDEWEQGDFGDDGEGGEGGPNNVVSVTEEERAAIARVSRFLLFRLFDEAQRSVKCELTRDPPFYLFLLRLQLEEMGFERNRVLEAFLLCDRNEEMAANYLFDSMNDE